MRDMHSRGISTITLVLVIGIVIVAVGAAAVYFRWSQRELVGSGNLDTKMFDFTDFTIVDAGYGFEVEIDQSSSYSIRITADDNVINKVRVTKSGSTLKIDIIPGVYQTLTLKAEITMPDLVELEFSGGTQGTVQGFSSSHDFVLTLSGGSGVEMEGAANDLTIDASGGSRLDLSAFPVHNADVVLSGGSRGTINLDGRLDADLSGGSQLQYLGEPTLGDIETSGGSTVKSGSVVSEAEYEVSFESAWSQGTHPHNFPNNPHFSGLIGATHNNQVMFWEEGQIDSPGIKNMAETGSKDPFNDEIDDAISDGYAFTKLSGDGISHSPGSVRLTFQINEAYPLVTLVSMIAPSPDWFIGVSTLDLFEDGHWINQKVVSLHPYDAGTDSGETFTSENAATTPPEPILALNDTLLPGSSTSYGQFTFTKLN